MPLFYSPHAGYRLLIKDQYEERHPRTGDVIHTDPMIWAEFGKYGDVQTFFNPETGETQQGAQIIGHYYDTDAEAAQNGWDQDTHDLVVRRLRDAQRREPYRVQEQHVEKPKAALPWPTYDGCDAAQVLDLAPTLGVVDAVLAYEAENRGRPAILDGLSKATEAPEEPDEDEDEGLPPAAVKAPQKPAEAGSRTISV